jgi:hypothetical protein
MEIDYHDNSSFHENRTAPAEGYGAAVEIQRTVGIGDFSNMRFL